jgi:arylsulfatase A-like enzyme
MFTTLCRLAGVELSSEIPFDGIDRSMAVKGYPLENRPRPLMWEYGRNEEFFAYPKQPRDRSPQLAIRDRDWKLLCNADGRGVELYDLAKDREEAKNLAKEHPDTVARLKKTLLEWRRSVP